MFITRFSFFIVYEIRPNVLSLLFIEYNTMSKKFPYGYEMPNGLKSSLVSEYEHKQVTHHHLMEN